MKRYTAVPKWYMHVYACIRIKYELKCILTAYINSWMHEESHRWNKWTRPSTINKSINPCMDECNARAAGSSSSGYPDRTIESKEIEQDPRFAQTMSGNRWFWSITKKVLDKDQAPKPTIGLTRSASSGCRLDVSSYSALVFGIELNTGVL